MKTDGQTIMVVEDCEADIDALVACLGQAYRVRVATDGPGALEDIKANAPDIVLLDILMPGMDGFEVCRRIKQDPEIRDIQVIFVTALTETVDETRGLEMGAIDYITKPFNFAVIRAKVKTHLDLARARRELTHQNRILKENIRLQEQVEQIYRHDLKTPIQAILGAAQLMKASKGMGREKQERLFQEQINACYTMMDMINRTMLLYKMEKKACPLDIRSVDIMPLIRRITLGLSSRLNHKEVLVNLSLDGAPDPGEDQFFLDCDEMLFYVMMSNLLINALDASPRGSAIDIRLQAQADRIKIEIENQGIVPEPIRDRFFDKFVTHGKSGGTGLGTYSARLTAELHGGSIGFEVNDHDQKTHVFIYLPR